MTFHSPFISFLKIKNKNSPYQMATRIAYSTISASMSSFMFGISLTSIECIKEMKEKNEIRITNQAWAIIISIICISALFACIGLFMSKNTILMSQKYKLVVNNILYLTGTLLLLKLSIKFIIVARLIIGAAIGITCYCVPGYLHSIAPREYSGLICSCHQIGIVVGVLAGQILTYFFSNHTTVLFCVLAIIIVHTISLFYIIQTETKMSRAKFKPLIQNVDAKKSIILAALIHCSQQVSCYNAVLNYVTTLFEKKPDPKAYAIFVGFVGLISTLISMFFIDRLGRRIILTMSYLTCIITLFILGINFTCPFLFVYIIGFNVGLGPVTWFITEEIFPEEYKEAGMMIGVSVNWMSYFIVALVFPFLHKIMGNATFILFGFLLSVMFLVFYGFYEETKGKEAQFQ